MGIAYAVGNVVLAARKYHNWGEVMTSIARKQEPAKVVLKDGMTIEAAVGLRFLVREIFFERIYNPYQVPIQPHDIVVDIGANCGVFTLFAATQTKNKVYAYEPFAGNFNYLQRNIFTNRLHHVVAHCNAVTDKVGTGTLFLNPLDGQQNVLLDHIEQQKVAQYKEAADLKYLDTTQVKNKDDGCIEVTTTTLQAIMDENDLDCVNFLKLDCEGAEGIILRTTPVAYLKRVQKIALEFHDHLSLSHHTEIQQQLQKAGFQIHTSWDGRSPLGYIYAWRDQ